MTGPFGEVMAVARKEAAVTDGAAAKHAIVAAAAELCTDAAGGGVAPADLERWVRAWAAARAAERGKWGFLNRG